MRPAVTGRTKERIT